MRFRAAIFALLLIPGRASAEQGNTSWKRSEEPPPQAVRVFHSAYAVNLPTAQMYQKGFCQFEISHRFIPAMSSGYENFYGLDGPANIRLALGYAVSDHIALTLGRTNLSGNVDLQLKLGTSPGRIGPLPAQFGIQLAGAWDTKDEFKGEFQGYAQAMLNVLLAGRVAVGVVPSYLYNSILESDETEHALMLGLYGQWYVTRIFSVLAEWNIAEAGDDYGHDAAAFGIELETGGHFFKIVAGNSSRLNLSQYLVGTSDRFEPDQWRLGFSITRLLHF